MIYWLFKLFTVAHGERWYFHLRCFCLCATLFLGWVVLVVRAVLLLHADGG